MPRELPTYEQTATNVAGQRKAEVAGRAATRIIKVLLNVRCHSEIDALGFGEPEG